MLAWAASQHLTVVHAQLPSRALAASACALCAQPHGLSCAENVVKECEEEASIPEPLAQRARPVGAVSYTSLKVRAGAGWAGVGHGRRPVLQLAACGRAGLLAGGVHTLRP